MKTGSYYQTDKTDPTSQIKNLNNNINTDVIIMSSLHKYTLTLKVTYRAEKHIAMKGL